jgi:hypothetical protein
MVTILRIGVTVILTSLVTVLIMSRYFEYSTTAPPEPLPGYTPLEVSPWPAPTAPLLASDPAIRAPAPEPQAPASQPLHARVDYDRLMADLRNVCDSLERFNAMLTDQIDHLRATAAGPDPNGAYPPTP